MLGMIETRREFKFERDSDASLAIFRLCLVDKFASFMIFTRAGRAGTFTRSHFRHFRQFRHIYTLHATIVRIALREMSNR